MDFLKEYWPLLVCVVLIIVAVVLLVIFRDKKEEPTQTQTLSKENDDKATNDTETKTETKTTEKAQEESLPENQEEANENAVDSEAETKENDNEAKKDAYKKYMVTYDKEAKQWVVKKTGASRASKRCKTKKEAMEVAEKLAESQDLNLTVKKKDGKFQKRENASK